MIDLEWVQRFCISLPGTTEDLKWGNDIVFSIGKKMYAVLSIEKEAPPRLSFRTTPELFEQFTRMDEIIPAPYLARHHWICLKRLDVLDEPLMKELLRDSYRSTLAKLPKKVRAEIETG